MPRKYAHATRISLENPIHKISFFLRSFFKDLIPASVKSNQNLVVKYLVLGLIIRFVLMPITSLPVDMIGNFYSAYAIGHYGMYDYFLYYASASPPLVAYILGGFFRFYEFLSPGFFFGKYVTMSPQNYPILYQGFPTENYQFYQILMSDPQVFLFLFAAKIPMLVFDIAIAFLFLRIFNDPKRSLLAFKLWMLNPITLYVIYMMGEIEIIPVFFALFGAYEMYVGKSKTGAVLLGLAAAMKPIALLLVPLAAFSANKRSLKKAIGHITIGVIPLAVSILFTSLVSKFHTGYQLIITEGPTVLYPSATSLWLRTAVDYSAHVPTFVEFTDVIYAFPLLYAIIFSLTVFSSQIDNKKIWELFTFLFAVMFAFNLFHSHWFLWYASFALVLSAAVASRKFLYLNFLIYAFFIVYAFYWWELQSALFMPLSPTIYQQGGVLQWMDNAGLQGALIINAARSAFSGLLVFSAIFSLKHAYFGTYSISDIIQALKTKVETRRS